MGVFHNGATSQPHTLGLYTGIVKGALSYEEGGECTESAHCYNLLYCNAKLLFSENIDNLFSEETPNNDASYLEIWLLNIVWFVSWSNPSIYLQL